MSPAERRAQLLDSVLKVIVNQGAHKVSIETVAKQAGVSRPVVYAHFQDSAELLQASLDREATAVMEDWAAVSSVGHASPTEALLALTDAFLASVLNSPDRWRAVFQLADSSTPAFRRRLESGRSVVIDSLTALARTDPSPGSAACADPELTGRTLFALLWQFGRTALESPDDIPLARLREHIAIVIPPLLTRA